jgi:phenylacetic acid degradation operon negative regulatory protein
MDTPDPEDSDLESPPSSSGGFAFAPQETILGLLGEYLEPGGVVWAGGFVRLFDDLGYTDGSARVSMNRVVARGLLERTRRGRLIFYSATPRLERLLEDGRRQTYYFQQPAESSDAWTLVWYVIPHEFRAPRRRLARRLSFLGFGLADDGLWVLPRDRTAEVQRAIRDLDVAEWVDVYLLDAKHGPQRRGPLIRTWDLDHINGMYEEFLHRFSQYASPQDAPSLDDRESFVARTALIESFRQLASLDPRLPASVIDRPWHRDQSVRVFAEANELLSVPARRHFLARTNPGAAS